MLPRLLLLLPGFLFFAFHSFGQAYEPGLLVRSNGDTLRGDIENGFWVEPPTFIRYRPSPESPGQLFKASQLRAFSFTGGRAFRYEGLPIDHAARSKVGNLPYENRPDVHIDSLLAEVLIDGAVSLVQVAQSERPVHYVLLAQGRPPLDLSERKYLRQTVDKAWLLTDGNNYRGQLAVYFGQCPAAHSASQKAPFTTQGLSDVVQAYNESCGPAGKPSRNLLALATPRRRVAFLGGVLAGARYNRIESYSLRYKGECVDCQVRPFGGLYGELLQPGRTVAIYGELSLSKFQSKGAQSLGYNATGVEQFNAFKYSAWLSTARLGVRYFASLPHEQQLLFGMGYELNFVMSPRVTTTSGPTATPSRTELFYAYPTLLPNFGLGWRHQRLTLSLDGQLYISSDLADANTSNFANPSQFTSSLFFGSNFAARLGLSYRLGRNPDAPKSAPAATK